MTCVVKRYYQNSLRDEEYITFCIGQDNNEVFLKLNGNLVNSANSGNQINH